MIIAALLLLFALDSTVSDAPPKTLAALHLVKGRFPADRFGQTLALVGDLDNDGILDFAVGAPGRAGSAGLMAGLVRCFSGTDGHALGETEGTYAFGFFGSSIASGDMEGDGHMEIMAGEPFFDAPDRFACGRVTLFHAPEMNKILTLEGDEPFARYGSALFCMDVNGDGFEDLGVGAPGASGSGGEGCGCLLVHSGRNGELLQRWEGESAGDWFGSALACIDANLDGFGDPVVAAPGRDGLTGKDEGEVYVFSGRDGSRLYTILPPKPCTRFGARLAALPDLTQDGVQEIALRALGGLFAGSHVFDGATGAFLFTLESGTSPEIGLPAPAGDVDRDGIVDLAGAGVRDGVSSLFVYSGKDGSVLQRWDCRRPVRGLGYSQAAALGAQFTGFPRFLLACHPYRDEEDDSAGMVGIWQLSPRGVLIRVDGPAAGARLGEHLAWIGDMNGDGVQEFAAGCPHLSSQAGKGAGRVFVYSCPGNGALKVLQGETPNSRLGEALCSLGDADGDGYPDFAVSAPGYAQKGRPALGRVYLCCSAKGILPEKLTGDQPGNRMGAALAAAGDVNGNGTPDLLVGAPGDPQAGETGRILLVDGADFRVLKTFQGAEGELALGSDLASVGDLDGDGVLEFAAAFLHRFRGQGKPKLAIHVFTPKGRKPLLTLRSREDSDAFGASLCTIHDLDGDKVSELLVGAPGPAEDGAEVGGRVYIFSGSTGRILGWWSGRTEGERLGVRLCRTRDQDGDGVPEIAMAAEKGESGRVYVIGSRTMSLLGVMDPEPEWKGFASSLCGLDPMVKQDPALFLAGASGYGGDALDQRGAVVVFGEMLPLAKPTGEEQAPEMHVEEVQEEAPPPPPTRAQPSAVEDPVAFAKKIGAIRARRLLERLKAVQRADPADLKGVYWFWCDLTAPDFAQPDRIPSALEDALQNAFVLHASLREGPEAASFWLRPHWAEARPFLAPAIGFSFEMEFECYGKVVQRVLACDP